MATRQLQGCKILQLSKQVCQAGLAGKTIIDFNFVIMDEETRKAYLAGLKLKHSGLSEEVIYARLEKQGIPEELARKVARDVVNENEKESLKGNLNYGMAIAIMGVLASIASYFIFKTGLIYLQDLLLQVSAAQLLRETN